jgi:Electron transfer DM13
MAVRAEHPPNGRPLPPWVRAAAVPVAIALVLLGIWVTGGVLTNDFRASMALTALWLLAVVTAALVVWRRVPALRPAAVAAVAAFALVGGYLAYASNVDKTVDENVATGPAAAEGTFTGLAHPTGGVARIVGRPDGSRVVTLTEFETDPGPDLFVYAVPGHVSGGAVDGGVSLGRLKGNIGDQQYSLPADFDASGGATVVVWCRAFSVAFGAAVLATR